jgi:CDP-diacylglycerol--glycerol-3-phosphate 3-phosphatidyltransferase
MSSQKQQNLRILPKQLVTLADFSANSIASYLAKLNLAPNFISFIALLLGLTAGILFASAKPMWAGIVIILCGFFDMVDGQLASKTDKKSLFGAIFDSTLDRYSEFFIFLGLAYYFRHHWALWLSFFTFFGSVMVSYTRARAEGLGVECEIGIMQRAERIGLLALGSVLGSAFRAFNPVIIAVLITIAAVSNFTAIQRIFHVQKMEKRNHAP